MTAPEISVVIPTRDRLHFLQRAVRCALHQQNGGTIEVVVVDDGSTDGTAAWLASQSPDLRVVRHERSRGLARARNSGIEECRGEWIAFLDDDDVWSPRKLRTQVQAAAAGNASWVYAGVVLVDEALRPRQVMPCPDPETVRAQLLASQVIPAGSSNVIVRSAVLHDVGTFDERLAHLADWDLWTRLALHGPAAATPELLVAYVEHGHNMHAAPDLDSTFAAFEYVDEKHRPAREQAGVPIDRDAFVRWAAWGHRRAGRRWQASALYARTALERRDPRRLKEAARALLGIRPLRWWRAQRPPEPDWLTLYR